MRNIGKFAAVATLAGALAVSAMTPSQAHDGRWGAAAIGFGAGALVGAAAASAAYNSGYYYGSDYAYAPGYYDYGYAPGYAYAPGYSYGYAYEPGYAYQPAPAYTYTAPASRSYAYVPAAPSRGCWVSTDNTRGFGYYGGCASNNQDTDAATLGRARRNVRAVK